MTERLEHPFVRTVEEDAKSAFSPEDFTAFKGVLREINHQAIDSFTVVNSQEYPETSFSTFCVKPTEKMVRDIQGKETLGAGEAQSAEDTKKRIFYFLEPHFHAGLTAGGSFEMLDAVTDRVFRELPKKAAEMQTAKSDEEQLKTIIQVMPLGSPIGFKGRVGKEFANEADHDGFNAYGKLYAEYIEKVVGEIDENSRIVIQGFSRGAVTGERTYHYLIQRLMDKHANKMHEDGKAYGDDEIEDYRTFLYQHVQGLYDEPAGAHRKTPWSFLKALNFVGLSIEDTIRRKGFKEEFLSPEYHAKENEFLDHLGRDVPDYTSEELARISKVVKAEYKHLALGTAPDREEPGSYRLPLFDPTNTRISQVLQESLGIGPERAGFSKGLWRSEGRKKFAVIKRIGHYHVPWRDSYQRWAKNIAACRRWVPNPPI